MSVTCISDRGIHHSIKAEADLFLDTLSYGAHVTAVDALWAGLPVITMSSGVKLATTVSNYSCVWIQVDACLPGLRIRCYRQRCWGQSTRAARRGMRTRRCCCCWPSPWQRMPLVYMTTHPSIYRSPLKLRTSRRGTAVRVYACAAPRRGFAGANGPGLCMRILSRRTAHGQIRGVHFDGVPFSLQ